MIMKQKILFVAQEITPYLPESEMSLIGRHLPQGIQEKGKEIRTFMPRFGSINERRNQLHEVIRLSGMNLIIEDYDHPLIIKVASIQSARMQVYFIDNEEFFKRKATVKDKNGKEFEDNDKRAVFFARGVIETVKKLCWSPDLVHVHGWFSAFVPLYLKKSYKDDPLFSDLKVVYSIYEEGFEDDLSKSVVNTAMFEGVEKGDLKKLAEKQDFVTLNKLAIDNSDAVILGSKNIHPELASYVKEKKIPVLEYQDPENYVDAYSDFYDKILEAE
ncbi:MAG: glycogen/starch synthase [Bacteroidota bacterium]